jgi:hypothetical protein
MSDDLNEVWREVTIRETEGFPVRVGYEISSLGKLRFNGRIQRGSLSRDGYTRYHISSPDRVSRRRRAHRMVAIAFIGPPPFTGASARHLDGNVGNNAVTNIAWGTRVENEQDKRRHGRLLSGEKVPTAKVTAEMVLAIVGMVSSGMTYRAAGSAVGASPWIVYNIISGRKWGSVTGIQPKSSRVQGAGLATET